MDASLHASDPPLRLLVAFQEYFPADAVERIIQAPGREMWVALAASGGNEFTIAAPDLEGQATFSLRSAKQKRTVMNRPLPRWARFPAGVALALAADGKDTVGFSAVIAGEEPAGPRYEYALGIAFAALWHNLAELPYTADSLIELVDRARRDYVEE